MHPSCSSYSHFLPDTRSLSMKTVPIYILNSHSTIKKIFSTYLSTLMMWSGVPKKYFQIRGLLMTNESPCRVMNRSLFVKWASSELIVCHCMANYHHFTAKDDLDNIHFLCTVVVYNRTFFSSFAPKGVISEISQKCPCNYHDCRAQCTRAL